MSSVTSPLSEAARLASGASSRIAGRLWVLDGGLSARVQQMRLGWPRTFGESADIANAVAWLASTEARYVTGQCFTVDGGVTAGSPVNPGLF